MEVHQHPHSERKKWTHYLWEFLMLFLAVFCGFQAENIREHNIEKERGLQYIQSFYEDLKTDTTQYNKLIDELTKKDAILDNIFNCFDSITHDLQSSNCLKDIIINSRGFTDFIYTDRTIQQLKFAGGLRLIQNKEIADSIISYDAMVREEQIHQEVMENQQQIVVNAHNSMIGFVQLQNLRKVDMKPVLLTNDKRELNKYFNEIITFKKSCLSQLRWMRDLKMTATRLMVFLKNKTGEIK